jgi:general secretion pathway protein K
MKTLRQESGMVLLLVLVVIALLSALVTELAFSTLVDLRLTETFRDSTRAYYLAKGGVHAGRVILQQDTNTYDATGDAAEFWSQGISHYPVGDGEVSVVIEDLGGRLNLNSLVDASGTNVNPTVKDRFYKLFDILGGADPVALTAALIDWIDQDNTPYVDPESGRPSGAEGEYYQGLAQPYPCKNAPIDTLGELAMIRDFTPEIIDLLTPHVTVFGGDQLNVNTASAEVLMTLSVDPEIDRDAAETIISRRESEPFKSSESLKELNDITGLANLLRTPFSITSAVYRITSQARVNDGTRQVEAVVEKSGNKLLYLKVD